MGTDVYPLIAPRREVPKLELGNQHTPDRTYVLQKGCGVRVAERTIFGPPAEIGLSAAALSLLERPVGMRHTGLSPPRDFRVAFASKLTQERKDPMKQISGTWQNRAFVFAFLVLTLFCWCPLGYGSYGPVPHLFGIPYWAVLALAFGFALFVLEWIYLFHTQLAISDEELPDIISQLKTVDTDNPVPAKPIPAKEDE